MNRFLLLSLIIMPPLISSSKFRSALTHFTVLKRIGQYSLIRCVPVTGRGHQIRLHMKALGCPIVGDGIHGEGEADRMYLHAHELAISEQGGAIVCTSDVPAEFYRFIEEHE